MTYQDIIATAETSPNDSMGSATAKNMYRLLFARHSNRLNFIENIGISQISKNDDKIISANIKNHPAANVAIQSPAPAISDAQKRALAGVGNPMNDVVCRLSILNLASLKAEKTAIRKAQYGRNVANCMESIEPVICCK